MDERDQEENDTILRYLLQQQKYQTLETETEDFQTALPLYIESPEDIEYNVEILVEELIDIVDDIIMRNEDYAEKIQSQNQYALFNMKKIIKDFEIDDAVYDSLTFRETLLVSRLDTYRGIAKWAAPMDCKQPEQMGGLCIDIQKGSGSQPFKREEPTVDLQMMETMERCGEGENGTADPPRFVPADDLQTQRRREMNKLLVHVSSDFDYYSKNGGSRITTWLDRNLHTLEELRREYLMQGKDIIQEKSLLTLLKPFKYYVKYKDYAEQVQSRKLYMHSKAKDYISEGADFVLMRYMAIRRFMGTFELSCMYISGEMCRNIYECLGPEGGRLNGQRIDICKIHRTIIEECGITHNCITVLTLNGQIIKQEWKGSNFILHVNPLMRITNYTPPGNDQILLQDCWVNDMQLLSRYLDDKSKSQLKMQSYLLDHPELKKMVADYIQEIILSNPADIIEYTIEHFLHFAPEYLPRYDFM